jgi:hypothetical protein
VAAGLVEGELAVAAALAQPAGAFPLLEHGDAVAVGGQHASQGDTGDAAAQDGDLHERGLQQLSGHEAHELYPAWRDVRARDGRARSIHERDRRQRRVALA